MDSSNTQLPPVEKKETLMTPIPHDSPKSMYILFILLLLVSWGFGLYILSTPTDQNVFNPFRNTLSPGSLRNLVTPPLTITPTQAPIVDTSAWNTYISKKYGYTVKYPLDWTVANLGQLEPKIPNYVSFNPNEATSSAKEIIIEYSTRTYQEALALGSANSDSILIASVSGSIREEEDSNHIISIFVILPVKQNTIIIRGHKKYENILTEMLSTFTLL